MRASAPLRAGAGGLQEGDLRRVVGLDREAPLHHVAVALADDDVDALAELDLPLDRLALAGRRRRAGVGLDNRRRRLAGRRRR